MRRYSKQEAVLLDMASGPGLLGPRTVAEGRESQIEEALCPEALDKDAWPAAAAAAGIVLEKKELEALKLSAGPDSCHSPCDRPAEVSGLVVDHNTLGQDEEAVDDACQRQTTLYVSFLGRALAGRRPMSWSGTFPEGGQHQRYLKTRHPVDNCHSGRDSPAAAGVGQEGQEVPGDCIGSRPCLLRCRRRHQSDRVFSADSRGEGGTNELRVVRRASRWGGQTRYDSSQPDVQVGSVASRVVVARRGEDLDIWSLAWESASPLEWIRP